MTIARGNAAVMENGDCSAISVGFDRVRDLTQLAVRQAMTAGRSGIRREPALADSLRAVCTEARGAGLHVEEVIVMIKQSWRSMVDSEVVHRDGDESALSEVVSRCITEYYRDRDERPRD